MSLRSLGQKVFSRPGAAAAAKEEETGWKESLYKFYKSGQQSMRVAVYGKQVWPGIMPGRFSILQKQLAEGRHAASRTREGRASLQDSILLRVCNLFFHVMTCNAGCKHDAGMFEELLKEYCLLDPAHSLGNTMIDSACLNTPKVIS